MKRRLLYAGIAVAAAAVIIGGSWLAWNNWSVREKLLHNPLVYSQSAALSETWHKFTVYDIEPDSGRVLDDHSSNQTSSRIQSLTLLRAVWIDDKPTFDRGWEWSKQNDRLSDGLLGDLYGPREDGSYGTLTQSSDSAADTNTALALLMAYRRWGSLTYLTDAQSMITAISQADVSTFNGKVVMAASDSHSGTVITTSPAALNPAAFTEFAKVDPTHDWSSLATTSRQLLAQMVRANGGQLPDSATVNLMDGTIDINDSRFTQSAANGIFNLGLDYEWHGNQADRTVLHMMSVPTIQASAQQSAQVMAYYDLTHDKDQADGIYQQQILRYYNQDKQEWRPKLNVSDDTWIWLAIGLHNSALPQLTEQG